MKKEPCKKQERKNAQVNIRINQKLSTWLNKEKLSPTGIFNEACKELGYNE